MEQKIATGLDLRIVASVVIRCVVATTLSTLNVKFPVGEMQLDIIQMMTACISCLLCCQDRVDASKKAGITRVIVTAIGGVVGIGVVALHILLSSNPWLLIPLVGAGVLATLLLCKLAGVPYMNARIGCISFLLVACTLSGTARIFYALFRLISTVFGVLVVLLVTMVVSFTKVPR